MALFAFTNDSKVLLADFKEKIDQGHIKTWSYDDDDGDFTHTPEQWKNKAWLRPTMQNGCLRLHLLGNEKVTTTWAIFGVYHGRFIEELITHFNDTVTELKPTVKPLAGVDQCTSGT